MEKSRTPTIPRNPGPRAPHRLLSFTGFRFRGLGCGKSPIPSTVRAAGALVAWKMRPDFVKVVPCSQVGGESYMRALKAMFPDVPLIAAGGVNQQTASSFILAGAVAVGIGAELIPREAIRRRQPDRIAELARRFTGFVSSARSQLHDG